MGISTKNHFNKLVLLVLQFATGAALASAGEMPQLFIESFLTPPTAGGPVVVAIQGDGITKLADGDLLYAARTVLGRSDNQLRFTTGRLKVNKIENGRALAAILDDGVPTSNGILGKFNKVMAGDLLHPAAVSFRQNLAMTPEITIEFHDLFSDPDALPDSMELTPAGRAKLMAAVAGLRAVRTRLVAVEGYVDPAGDSVTNQVESYERAMTVRRFLVNNLGFDPERITAFGMGEQEPVDASNLVGSARRNRRIVIKVIPLGDEYAAAM